MISPQAASALCAAILALAASGCDEKSTTRLAQFLGESPALEGMDLPSTAVEPDQSTVPEPSAPSSEECVTIFAKQTCENGVLHHLDGAFNWID